MSEPRSARKELRLRPSMLAEINAVRGDVSFNRFVERALEAALDGGAVPDEGRSAVPPGDVPAASPRASARPAKPFRPLLKGK